jgi:hypothetical protein
VRVKIEFADGARQESFGVRAVGIEDEALVVDGAKIPLARIYKLEVSS